VTHDTKLETAGLDTRRRKLVFRCWHRGTREMDLLLGRYVDAHAATMDDADVVALEYLLEAPDPELFGWLSGGKPVPPNYDTPMLHSIRAFHENNPVSQAF